MPNKMKRARLLAAVMIIVAVTATSPAANAQAQKQRQNRVNDFPSVRGYDPGYDIAYDPTDPYIALEYLNWQFDGVWADIDSGNLDVRKYNSRAPQAEDYTDPNRPNPTPNTPKLTANAARVFREIRPMILDGNNPAQAVGWCFLSHPPTTSIWNQFMFTPDAMNVSIPGGNGVLYTHIYMDGRSHPPNVKPTELGHGVARWEGEWLVIDQVGFVADRDLEIGLLNSDQQHIVTRYRRVWPDLLEAVYTITDPKVFTEPWTFKRRFRRVTMDVNLSRDPQHCVVNANKPDESGGGNQLLSPDGEQLQVVPVN